MKPTRLFALAATLFLLGACSNPSDTPPPPKSATTLQDVKEQTSEALKTTGNYISDQTAKTRVEIKKRLDELQPEIDRLKAKADASSADAKVKIQEQLAKLDAESHDLREKLKSAGHDAGAAIKEGAASVKADLANPATPTPVTPTPIPTAAP